MGVPVTIRSSDCLLSVGQVKAFLGIPWSNLQKIIKERDAELLKEYRRQEDNDKLRQEFARQANDFHQVFKILIYCLERTRIYQMGGKSLYFLGKF